MIAATATRVAAFSPLLFWPGVVGAVHEIPADHADRDAVGLARGRAVLHADARRAARQAPRRCRTTSAPTTAGPTCARCGSRCAIPARRWRSRSLLLVAVQMAYGKFGHGVEFFPDVEPDYGQVIVHARGNLSLDEKDRAGRARSRSACSTFDGPQDRLYPRRRAAARHRANSPRTPSASSSSSSPTGSTRPPAHEIMDAIRDKTADIPGILVEVTAPRAGPPTGKPIQVQLAALDPDVLPAAAKKVAGILRAAPRHPRPRRRPAAARHRLEDRGRQGGGRQIRRQRQHRRHRRAARHQRRRRSPNIGPSDSDKAVDILVRFPHDRRSLDQIDELRVQTPAGHVPIGNFVERVPAQRVGYINRVNGNRVMTVSANVAEGVQTRQGAAGDRARSSPRPISAPASPSSSRARTRSAPRPAPS